MLLKFDWGIFYTFINIIVLFLFLKKFLFKPVTEMIEKRKTTIQDLLQDAEAEREAAHKLKNDYDEELRQAGDQATGIIKEAKERAEQEYNRIMQEANADAMKVMAEADKAIELERKKSLESAQAEIAGIALLAAAKVINKNIDSDANKQMLGDFLKEVGTAV